MPASKPRLRRALLTWLATGFLGTGQAQQDGGPDYYRVSGVSPGSVLNLRAGPSVEAAVLARIPAGATGLRNLGCEGGLSFAEWSAATEAEREAGRRRRWCRVEYRGTEGWAAGWFLVEGGPR